MNTTMSSQHDDCKGGMGMESNGKISLWRGFHQLGSILTAETSVQKNPHKQTKPNQTPLRRRSAYLKEFFITWGSHCSGVCSTQYHCCVERNVSDLQDIKRWVSFLGLVLLFLKFINSHRQTHEDFRANCS